MGSGSQVLNEVRLSGSKADSYYCQLHLPIALDNQPANFCIRE